MWVIWKGEGFRVYTYLRIFMYVWLDIYWLLILKKYLSNYFFIFLLIVNNIM